MRVGEAKTDVLSQDVTKTRDQSEPRVKINLKSKGVMKMASRHANTEAQDVNNVTDPGTRYSEKSARLSNV